ncbi:MAG: HEAT repeat domain-containing protein, partial [Planctomycetota bacterium]
MTRRRVDRRLRPGRRTWRRLRSALLSALPVLLLLALPTRRAAPGEAGDRNLEPAPPWIFFSDPDPVTEEIISAATNRGFGDLNQVVSARRLLVERFGVWSVRKLAVEIRKANNQPRLWNSALTVYCLRDTLGNARELWGLIGPLTRVMEESGEPYSRAFSALAIGSFRGPSFVPTPPSRPDPLVRHVPEKEARAALDAALAAVGRLVHDGHPHVEVAATLALAKSGAQRARELLCAEECVHASGAVEPREATLLAMGLLPGQDDVPIFLDALRDVDRRIRRAAALGTALQALLDVPPAWTRSPRRILRALVAPVIKPDLEDGAEAVFARGVF